MDKEINDMDNEIKDKDTIIAKRRQLAVKQNSAHSQQLKFAKKSMASKLKASKDVVRAEASEMAQEYLDMSMELSKEYHDAQSVATATERKLKSVTETATKRLERERRLLSVLFMTWCKDSPV